MTTLLIQSDQIPLTVSFPALVQMTDEQFYEFCQANRDLRIERTAIGEVIIMPPAFSDTGNRNMKISQQVANWAEQDGTGEVFDSSAGFTLPNGATRSPDACWIKLERWNRLYIENGAVLGFLIDRKNRTVHSYRRDRTPEILEQPETVSGDPEMPRFVLQMAKIW